jgi:hypothetical protein
MSAPKCRAPKCGKSIRTLHGQFLCQTHWRMVPGPMKSKLFAARERARSGHGKTALKEAEAEACRAVRAALAKVERGGV